MDLYEKHAASPLMFIIVINSVPDLSNRHVIWSQFICGIRQLLSQHQNGIEAVVVRLFKGFLILSLNALLYFGHGKFVSLSSAEIQPSQSP